MQGDRNGGDQADPRVDPRGEGGRGGERRGEADGAGAGPQGRARPLPRAHVPQKHLLPAQEQEQVWMPRMSRIENYFSPTMTFLIKPLYFMTAKLHAG